jgi:hypothetical protein
VIQRVTALARGVDGYLKRGLDLALSDKFIQPGRPERGISAGLFRQSFGGRDFESGHV